MLDRARLLLRLLPALPKLSAHKPTGHHTAGDLLERQALRHAERPAVLFEEERISYEQLNARANRVAHWAHGEGLRSRDVVALLMENRPEYLATWLGLSKLGVVTALINTNLTGRALQHALATSHARHLVVGGECLDRFETTADLLAQPLDVWVAVDGEAAPTGRAPAAAHDLDAALRSSGTSDPDPALRESVVSGDDLFYIYTSGTTGLPKAARFSHLRFLSIGELCAFALSLTPDDVHYCALPLYHTAGGVMLVGSALSAGAAIALRRKFSASRFWDDVRKYDATCFQYIGEFCRYLINQPPGPGDRDHRVRAIIGNGLRPDIWAEFQQRFGIRDIREFYGATEGNTAIMNLENKVGSVGRMPFRALTNARLVRYDIERDEHPRGPGGFCIPCGPGEPGEMLGKIPKKPGTAVGRFEGYTSEEATSRKILRDVFEKGDAWFRTGDLLREDRDGFLYFVDRIGDTFRWKGENVSTQEVAEALTHFHGVEMVNVYGVEVPGADGRAGMAALVLAPDAAFDGAAFYALVDEALPRYAAPVFVRRLAEQEVTGTFKIRKVDLVREGFDPTAIRDPLLFRDDAARAYVPLTVALYDEIVSGRRTL